MAVGEYTDQLRHHKDQQQQYHCDRHPDQNKWVNHRHFQFLAGVLALLRVVRQLLQHRPQETGMLAGVDHGAVHFIEHARKLAHRVGQCMALGHARSHLQQHRLDTVVAALLGRRLQRFIQWQIGLHQRCQLASDQRQIIDTDS